MVLVILLFWLRKGPHFFSFIFFEEDVRDVLLIWGLVADTKGGDMNPV